MPSLFISQLPTVHWENAPAKLDEPDGQVHVWRIHVSDHHRFLANLLTADEREKINRYHKPEDRNRFAVSRGGLRFLLEKYSIQSPGDQLFGVKENKKPFLQASSMEYNIAHSGDYVVFAFAKKDIGIDIEQTHLRFAYAEMMLRCFHEKEIAFVEKSGDPLSAFYLLWTRKEALLKATGKGIDNYLQQIPCVDEEQQVSRDSIGSECDWKIQSLVMNESFTISIAHAPDAETLCFWEAGL